MISTSEQLDVGLLLSCLMPLVYKNKLFISPENLNALQTKTFAKSENYLYASKQYQKSLLKTHAAKVLFKTDGMNYFYDSILKLKSGF